MKLPSAGFVTTVTYTSESVKVLTFQKLLAKPKISPSTTIWVPLVSHCPRISPAPRVQLLEGGGPSAARLKLSKIPVVGNGSVEGETLELGLADADGLAEPDGLRDADGDGVGLTDALGETEAEGLTDALSTMADSKVISNFAAFAGVLSYV